jgi:dTDP-4-dehydrorhamnose reductase
VSDGVKILVLGATGLLGNAMFRSMSKTSGARVAGTIRSEAARSLFAPEYAAGLAVVEDIENPDALVRLFDVTGPDVVINCIAVGRAAPGAPNGGIGGL